MKKVPRVFFLLTLIFLPLIHSETTVTYDLSSGRFGDNLIGYMHAKWISYHYGFTLLYVPFTYSDQLVLHEKERLWQPSDEGSGVEVICHEKGGHFGHQGSMPLLYRLPYFPHCPADLLQRDDWPTIAINWSDEGFIKELKKMIQPIHPPLPFSFPTDRPYITIAAHVRTGRGSDAPDSYKWWPLKFAPHQFYIESLRHIARIFPEKPLFVYLFTDDPEPEQIIELYKSQLPSLDVTFECRRKNNTHNQNVVEDWFSMLQFDCLIRSTSSYTFVQAMIGDYKVVISPSHYVWKDDQVYIDQKFFKYHLHL